MEVLNRIFKMVLGNPYTTLIGAAALVFMAVYFKVLTPAQIVNYILTAAVGFAAHDGGNVK